MDRGGLSETQRVSLCHLGGLTVLFTHERVLSFVGRPNTTCQIQGEGWRKMEEEVEEREREGGGHNIIQPHLLSQVPVVTPNPFPSKHPLPA